MSDLVHNTPSDVEQPQSHGITSRRVLALGGVVTAVAGLIGVVPTKPAVAGVDLDTDSPDLVLVQLCARIVADRKQQDSLTEQMFDLLPGDSNCDMVERQLYELDDETRQLALLVGELPALTTQGVQARAAAIKAMMPSTTL